MPQVFNVLITAEFKNITEDAYKEICFRLEEHCLEKIPTLESAWEFKVAAEDESEAKHKALHEFNQVCCTYHFECAMLVHAGTGQILRRRKRYQG
mgnify:CR=1 FL=1